MGQEWRERGKRCSVEFWNKYGILNDIKWFEYNWLLAEWKHVLFKYVRRTPTSVMLFFALLRKTSNPIIEYGVIRSPKWNFNPLLIIMCCRFEFLFLIGPVHSHKPQQWIKSIANYWSHWQLFRNHWAIEAKMQTIP